MEIWTAFVLGLAGSLHCAGMCGPLVLAVPAAGPGPGLIWLGRLAYNGGRVLTYVLIGTLLGLAGGTLAWAGIARWVSIATGAALLTGALVAVRPAANSLTLRASAWVRAALAPVLRRRGLSASFALGVGNGLLPCGLVYTAAAVALTAPGPLTGAGSMLAFGLGTVPMMLAIGLGGIRLQMALRLRFPRAIPACLIATGLLLICRGMALGIPYLSPAASGSCPHCRF